MNRGRLEMKTLVLGAALLGTIMASSAEAEIINCTEITTLPTVITRNGIYCLKHDRTSSVTSGNIIEIQANNVTIDLNGFSLNGQSAGASTLAIGIHALNRQNITIRNGTIHGFLDGVGLDGDSSKGHLLENLLLEENRHVGIFVRGTGHVIRNNRVVDTGPGASNEADGIELVDAESTLVADNIISGTSETDFAEGVRIVNSTLIDVRGNTVLDTKGATTTRGIDVSGSNKIAVISNHVLNATVGTEDIVDSGSSTNLSCIDNTVTGFSISLAGCDFLAGNNIP
jgi:hypothetical protein